MKSDFKEMQTKGLGKIKEIEIDQQLGLIRNKLERTYKIMQGRFITRFHKPSNIHNHINLTTKSSSKIHTKNKPAELISKGKMKLLNPNSNSNCKREDKLNNVNLDWTRRRFKGEIISIVIKAGAISRKVYKTNKGSIIVVRYKELGIFKRLLSNSNICS